MELLKEKLCQYFRFLLKGSKFYIGKPMPEVHKDLGITNEVFDSAAQIFTDRLKAMKPKLKVFRSFFEAVNGIRDQICFPPVVTQEETVGSLFVNLGQEIGLRNIVDSMLEQARINKFPFFQRIQGQEDNAISQMSDEQIVTKYSMFLASLLDNRYTWFKKDLVASGQLNMFLIQEQDLETFSNFFRTACVKNDLKKHVIVNFLDFLLHKKDKICVGAKFFDENNVESSLMNSLEVGKKFNAFVERFFRSLQDVQGVENREVFQLPDTRQEIIWRISKILHCQNTEELSLDKATLEDMPVNSNEPMFIAAECFRDTLIGIGVLEEPAEAARRAFLALQKNNLEET